MMSWLYLLADGLRRRRSGGNLGRMGEDLAHRFLRSRGCTVVARNYRTMSGSGEIDLVVWHGGRLVFVEVKTRSSADFGTPDAAVDSEKQERLRRAARSYALRARVDWDKTRFDIVSVVVGRRIRIDWRKDAFAERRAGNPAAPPPFGDRK